jgi:hypothetical protein
MRRITGKDLDELIASTMKAMRDQMVDDGWIGGGDPESDMADEIKRLDQRLEVAEAYIQKLELQIKPVNDLERARCAWIESKK